MINAINNEFYGIETDDKSHVANTFLNQSLCQLQFREGYKCIMQDLLYQT